MTHHVEMWWLDGWRCGGSLIGECRCGGSSVRDVVDSSVGYVVAQRLEMWWLNGWRSGGSTVGDVVAQRLEMW